MAQVQPARLEGRLDEPLSRWLWLVKWALAIPHYIVLFFLFVAFFGVTLVAFFAVLFTGRYPRGLFDFNVGVLRWAWRVGFYSYSALGTDKYPPFSLGEHPDYPATLEVDYPEQLSHGLVLVKWLLVFPHALVVGVLLGTSTYTSNGDYVRTPGLISVLVLIVGVALLFTNRYLPDLFGLIVGLNRWVLRAGAYVFLLTDHYPPFRLDTGGQEPSDLGPAPPGSSSPEPIAP